MLCVICAKNLAGVYARSFLTSASRWSGKPVGGNKSALLWRIAHEAEEPKKARKRAAAGALVLSDALPETAGPWLKKCVEAWGLTGPFNTSVRISAAFAVSTVSSCIACSDLK